MPPTLPPWGRNYEKEMEAQRSAPFRLEVCSATSTRGTSETLDKMVCYPVWCLTVWFISHATMLYRQPPDKTVKFT